MFEQLRAKPEPVGKQLALGVTIILFGIIFFVWFSSWDARTTKDKAPEKTASPTASFGTVFQGFVTEVKDKIQLFSPQSSQGTPEETTEGKLPAATSTFDISGIIVIDRSHASSTETTISRGHSL